MKRSHAYLLLSDLLLGLAIIAGVVIFGEPRPMLPEPWRTIAGIVCITGLILLMMVLREDRDGA
jgi:hypothetical protein